MKIMTLASAAEVYNFKILKFVFEDSIFLGL